MAAWLLLAAAVASAAVGCMPALSAQRDGPAVSSASTASDSPQGLEKFYQQQVAWEPCDHGFECGYVRVPLAYEDPSGPEIGLAVIRLPAGNPDSRIGSLFVNPGGPGASGVDYARSARGSVGEGVLERFDVVGFDPRGVGGSSPITCLDGPQTDLMLAVLGAPTKTNSPAVVAGEAASFGAGCAARSPTLVANIGTVAAARDLDILRGVVGDAKLNFLGRSYGTFLGATYEGLFPGRVGRFVLDGAIAPTLTLADLARGQADGFEGALGRFASDCARRSECPLPRAGRKERGRPADPQPGVRAIDRWLQHLAESPLNVDGRQLTRPLATTAILGSLYDQSVGWPALRRALAAGFQGRARPAIDIVDEFVGRDSDGKYGDHALDALYAVNCLDHDDRADVAATERLAAEWSATSPTFGEYFAWGNLPCATWPAPPTDSPHEVTAPGAGPTLVVGTRHDPATPFVWAERLASMLSNASLLAWEGDGHTAYGRGSDCVDNAVDQFLVSGALPPDGTRC